MGHVLENTEPEVYELDWFKVNIYQLQEKEKLINPNEKG